MQINQTTLAELLESIDVPDSAYEKAESRYRDLGEWFGRSEAQCAAFEPHIHAQGSFRLGTVVRPLKEDEEYDLDISCRLRRGISKANCTQQQLKALIGADLADYRRARRIQAEVEEKHRCWRLQYADTLPFHMDVVPTLPETATRRGRLREALIRAGVPTGLVEFLFKSLGSITDNRLPNYRVVSEDWLLSDPEGFAQWFEARMKLAKGLVERVVLDAKAVKIDDLPAYRWRSPLQRAVQLLKRHRDVRFTGDESAKPPSIILTTLAARAYRGEEDIGSALEGILATMGSYVNTSSPRIPNPVNPDEDFADRWSDPESADLELERKFWEWLEAAQQDFRNLGTETRRQVLLESAKQKLGVTLPVVSPGRSVSSLLRPAAAPAALTFPKKEIVPKNPAGFA